MEISKSPTGIYINKAIETEDEQEEQHADVDEYAMHNDVDQSLERNIEKAVEFAILSSINIAMQPYEKKYGADEAWWWLNLDQLESDCYYFAEDAIERTFTKLKYDGIKE